MAADLEILKGPERVGNRKTPAESFNPRPL